MLRNRKALESIKTALVSAPVLQFPDYSKPFTVFTDASRVGLDAVLMQSDSRGKLGPITYASRRLNRAESNYSTTDLECLAIVWGL